MPTDLPDACLRGLRKSAWVKLGQVHTAAFVADDKAADAQRKANGHTPPGSEISINWEDSSEVVDLTLKGQNAQHGAARLLRAELDTIESLAKFRGRLAYERREVEGNPHHGNVIYVEGGDEGLRASLAAVLAAAATLVPPRK